ncbi:uncharacterized protein LOC115627560 [Scaptodrosophila lebanonensis]|uniref:Uncharacterized protein LOC115627560 n=1 Tax=Drosophila lebanonensis TaxID=7225 RepID=A0A6J2TR51_DROLE|nr:uncharacterized protein LOC115627560 [Scaptodrosophila lebanonensis]
MQCRMLSLVLLLVLLLMLMQGQLGALAQNPIEQMALGAMSVAGNIAETIQSGAAIDRQIGFENPFMSVRSKTAVGYGQAIRPRGADDSSDESDGRRRKREAPMERQLLPHLHRTRRAPCMWSMMGQQKTDEAEDDVEARKRRAAARRATNNAQRTRKVRKKKHIQSQRRRRQVPEQQQMLGDQFGQQPPSFGQRLQGMWVSFMDSVTDVIQQIRNKVAGNNNNQQQ